MARQPPLSDRVLLRWYLGSALAVIAVVVADIWVDFDYGRAANIALLFAAALVNAFTVLYLFRSRWYATQLGRIYLVKCVILSLVLDQISAAIWIDLDFPGRQHIRFIIYTFGALVYLPMLAALWREQQRDRREQAEDCHVS